MACPSSQVPIASKRAQGFTTGLIGLKKQITYCIHRHFGADVLREQASPLRKTEVQDLQCLSIEGSLFDVTTENSGERHFD